MKLSDTAERVLIVAGKSGGHILPGVAVGREYHEQGSSVSFIAEDRDLDRSLLQKQNWLVCARFFKLRAILLRKWWLLPVYCYELVVAFFVSLYVLSSWRVQRVVSMGGYCSVPVCLAARCLRIPYLLYELNAEPGKAVRWLASKAAEIVCCFPVAVKQFNHQAVRLAAYPLYAQPSSLTRVDACALLSIDFDRIILVILGGSQGSRSLNELCMQWLQKLSPVQRARLYLLHQTGTGNEIDVRARYDQLRIAAQVCAYTEQLPLWYAAANYAVTRAGSGALHELQAAQVPGLIIPLEAATTAHQVSNAQEFVRLYPHLYCMVRQQEVVGIEQVLNRVIACGDQVQTKDRAVAIP